MCENRRVASLVRVLQSEPLTRSRELRDRVVNLKFDRDWAALRGCGALMETRRGGAARLNVHVTGPLLQSREREWGETVTRWLIDVYGELTRSELTNGSG